MTSTTMSSNRRRDTSSSSHQYYYSNTPSYFATSSSSPSLLKGCCCCLFLLFSLLALLTLAVILVIILAVKPKKPSYDLQQVAVQYVGISPTTTPGTPGGVSLSLSVRLIFTAVNPNKVGIKYGESRFTVMYRGIPLGRGIVPGFYQPAHSVSTVTTVVTVDRVNLMQADASDLVKDASMYDKVELRVIGDVSARIRLLNLDSPGVEVSVDCEIVLSPKKQSLIYKQCGFDGLHLGGGGN